jgi:site-specific DNA-methyltransferase (adenine-specific)
MIDNNFKSGKTEIIQGDCMDYMRTLKDNAFELAIVDPPYGIGAGSKTYGKRKIKHIQKNWDESTPKDEYFTELFRISKIQVIWGGNYFKLPLTGSWLFWDKDRGKETAFSDGELAWTNVGNTLKKVTVRYDGFIGADITRIHPTQKPVKLYDWLLSKYAKEGDKILDTHLGSGSSAIAAHYAGFEFVGIELDEDYYKAAISRFESTTSQNAFDF